MYAVVEIAVGTRWCIPDGHLRSRAAHLQVTQHTLPSSNSLPACRATHCLALLHHRLTLQLQHMPHRAEEAEAMRMPRTCAR